MIHPIEYRPRSCTCNSGYVKQRNFDEHIYAPISTAISYREDNLSNPTNVSSIYNEENLST
ncbi:hypothetical protein G9A89_005015 [Geosiphon pyriformis]|nr:hypothetical protein G9A89_005015 [Geosiphon pyriformis]